VNYDNSLVATNDYHSNLLLMGTIYRWPFIYVWRHRQAATVSNW